VKDLAPQITRQRLLVEGFYTIDVDRDAVDRYLHGVAAHLGLRAYGEATIFSPGGEGKAENQGFDAFLPLIDSGISLYVWSSARFFSAILYTCKRFDDRSAVAFTREFFGARGEVASTAF
jgi:S-adenosylmethionine decarboxylase